MLLQNKLRAGSLKFGGLTLVTSAVSTTVNLTAPSGIQAGDLLVLFDFISAISASAGVPGDMTQIGSTFSFSSTGRFVVSYKIADGTESGNSYNGCNGSSSQSYRKTMLVFRGNRPISSLSVSATVAGEITAGNPAQATNAASSGTPAPCLGLTCFSCATGGVDPRTTSITPDQEIANGTVQYTHLYMQNSSPADYTFDMDDEGTMNAIGGVYFYNFQ